MAGMYLMYAAQSGFDLLISGVLLGIGVSGTGLTSLVGAVGRAAPPDKRTSAIASLGMAAGIGGFVAFPYTHLLMDRLRLADEPAAAAGDDRGRCCRSPGRSPASRPPVPAWSTRSRLGAAFKEALTHPSYLLLITGFFVCGFHVAFYGVHLPGFVADKGLDASVAVIALTMVGLANLVGTFIAGQSGRFIEKRRGLSLIYFGRCFIFLGLLFLPITPEVVIGLSILLGLFWLSTVPLTSSLVAVFFGTRWMSMLFGVVFLSHQLGSFCGLVAGRLSLRRHQVL